MNVCAICGKYRPWDQLKFQYGMTQTGLDGEFRFECCACSPQLWGWGMSETAQEQIDRLARFIMEKVHGEPSQSQGAVDTAIRLLREHIAHPYPEELPKEAGV